MLRAGSSERPGAHGTSAQQHRTTSRVSLVKRFSSGVAWGKSRICAGNVQLGRNPDVTAA